MLEAESFVNELASRFRLAGTLIASAGHCWLRVAGAFPSSTPPQAGPASAFSRPMASKQEPQPPCRRSAPAPRSRTTRSGGGSGGLANARRAAELGARAAVVERHKLGGTCVNVGCVSKKVMWNTAVHPEFMHDHVGYAFQSCESKFNWRIIKEKRDAYVSRLNTIYQNNLTKVSVSGFELWEGAVLCWRTESGQAETQPLHLSLFFLCD